MSQQSLEQFRQLVLQDVTLQEQLRATTDKRQFVALVVQLSAQHGYTITVEDIEAGIQVGRRSWIERWI